MKTYITVRVNGRLIDFERMRLEEGLCAKKLQAALGRGEVQDAPHLSLALARSYYDNTPGESEGERKALQALALHYTTADPTKAQMPVHNGSASGTQSAQSFRATLP